MEKNFNYLPLVMTREEYDSTDFMKKTFNLLYEFNKAHYWENEPKLQLTYEISFSDSEMAPIYSTIKIDEVVYWLLKEEKEKEDLKEGKED